MILIRSANGMGTITKRKGVTKPYLVYGAAVNVDGIMKRPYLGSYRTKKEAEQRRIEYYQNPNITKGDLTFMNVFEEYKKSKRYTNLSKSGKDNYIAAYKHCENLYAIKFKNLRTAQLQEVIDRLYDKGMSKSSLEKVRNLISLLYGYALENDIVNKNYTQFIVMPEIAEKEKRILSADEIQIIKNAALGGNKAAKWTFYLICSGWRIGEMLELTPESYNADGKYMLGGKKTKAGKNRIVPVCSCVQWIVDEQLLQNGDTIFCMPSGKPMTPNYFRKMFFQRMLEELGIDEKITPHNMRHTFSSLLKKKGADDFYRRALLGHSQKGITDKVYTHAEYEELKATIELLKDI